MKASADARLPANPIHPRIRTAWTIGTVALATVVTAGAVAAFALADLPIVLGLPVALVAYPVAIWAPATMHARWRYEIRERDVFLAHGLFVFKTVLVPFDRIQYVETNQGPLDRWFTLTQLTVRTAGGAESIPGLEISEANRLREELSRVAGTTSV